MAERSQGMLHCLRRSGAHARSAPAQAVALLLFALLVAGSIGERRFDFPVQLRTMGTEQLDVPTVAAFVNERQYRELLFFAEHHAGIHIVRDRGMVWPAADVTYAVTRAATLEFADLSHVRVVPGSEKFILEFDWGFWRISLDEGRPDVVLQFERDGSVHYVDARIAEGFTRSISPLSAVDAVELSPWRRIASEVIVLGGFHLAGLLLLVGSIVPPSVRPWLALLVGASAFLVLAFPLAAFQHGTLAAGLALPVLSSLAALRVRRSMTQRKAATQGPSNVVRHVGAIAVFVVTPVVVIMRGLVAATQDSVDYLSGGKFLADGLFTVSLLRHEFQFGQQILHSLGFGAGSAGLQSLGSVVSVMSMLLVGTVAADRSSSGKLARLTLWTAMSLFLVNGAMRNYAAYVNAHMMVAGLLAVLYVIWLLSNVEHAGPSPSQLPKLVIFAIIVALVLLRGEAPLVIALLAIGMQLTPHPTSNMPAAGRWAFVWGQLGIATGLWHGFVLLSARASGSAVPASARIGALLAVVFLATWWASRRLSPDWLLVGGRLAVVSLWLALAAVLVLVPAQVAVIETTRQNVLVGVGRYGILGIFLALSAGLLLAVARSTEVGLRLRPARYLVAGYFPAIMLPRLASSQAWAPGASIDLDLISQGARLGWSDSVNRIWFHLAVVLLLALLLALTESNAESSDALTVVGRGAFALLAGTTFFSFVAGSSWQNVGAVAYRMLGLTIAAFVVILAVLLAGAGRKTSPTSSRAGETADVAR